MYEKLQIQKFESWNHYMFDPIWLNTQNHHWSFSFAINWKEVSARPVVYVIYWHFPSSVFETVYSTKSEATRVFPLLLWNTHMHMKLLTQTHTHAVDVVIERAGVSWEYESGSMTSLLFTGIRSSLVPTPPPVSNHIGAVQLLTRLVMSKAHLTARYPFGGDLTHVTHGFTFFLTLFSYFSKYSGSHSLRYCSYCTKWEIDVFNP